MVVASGPSGDMSVAEGVRPPVALCDAPASVPDVGPSVALLPEPVPAAVSPGPSTVGPHADGALTSAPAVTNRTNAGTPGLLVNLLTVIAIALNVLVYHLGQDIECGGAPEPGIDMPWYDNGQIRSDMNVVRALAVLLDPVPEGLLRVS